MKLVPKDRNGAIKEIVVSFRNDYTPLRVMILEKNGDSTILEFSDQKVNPPWSEALFDVKIPPALPSKTSGNSRKRASLSDRTAPLLAAKCPKAVKERPYRKRKIV